MIDFFFVRFWNSLNKWSQRRLCPIRNYVSSFVYLFFFFLLYSILFSFNMWISNVIRLTVRLIIGFYLWLESASCLPSLTFNIAYPPRSFAVSCARYGAITLITSILSSSTIKRNPFWATSAIIKTQNSLNDATTIWNIRSFSMSHHINGMTDSHPNVNLSLPFLLKKIYTLFTVHDIIIKMCRIQCASLRSVILLEMWREKKII